MGSKYMTWLHACILSSIIVICMHVPCTMSHMHVRHACMYMQTLRALVRTHYHSGLLSSLLWWPWWYLRSLLSLSLAFLCQSSPDQGIAIYYNNYNIDTAVPFMGVSLRSVLCIILYKYIDRYSYRVYILYIMCKQEILYSVSCLLIVFILSPPCMHTHIHVIIYILLTTECVQSRSVWYCGWDTIHWGRRGRQSRGNTSHQEIKLILIWEKGKVYIHAEWMY